jgi:hypothetical protein
MLGVLEPSKMVYDGWTWIAMHWPHGSFFGFSPNLGLAGFVEVGTADSLCQSFFIFF